MVDESIVSEDGVTLSKELDSSRDNLPVNDVSPKSCVNSDVDSCSGDDVNAIEAERLARDLNSQHALPRINTTRSLNDLTSHLDSPVALSRCSSSGDMRHPSPHGHYTFPDQVIPVNVALALSYKLIDDEWLWEKVRSYFFTLFYESLIYSRCHVLKQMQFLFVFKFAADVLRRKLRIKPDLCLSIVQAYNLHVSSCSIIT